jgi:hypothetical protein
MSSQLATDEENPHKKLATPVFATFSGLSQIPSLILFVTEFYPFCDGIVPSLKLNFLVVSPLVPCINNIFFYTGYFDK